MGCKKYTLFYGKDFFDFSILNKYILDNFLFRIHKYDVCNNENNIIFFFPLKTNKTVEYLFSSNIS